MRGHLDGGVTDPVLLVPWTCPVCGAENTAAFDADLPAGGEVRCECGLITEIEL